jgi:4'-phosphopantetheinyl transferase
MKDLAGSKSGSRNVELKRLTTLAPGEVHILFSNLNRDASDLARLERYLSTDERARAERLRSGRVRDRFVAGRGFLRYTGVPPEEIRFSLGNFGKPGLTSETGFGILSFNLSHADDLAILAIAGDRELGIDLEKISEGLPYHEMARIFFSHHELEELITLPTGKQLAAFYRCWTRKEAYLKGCGRGFSQPSDSFDVSLLPGHPPALTRHLTSPDEPSKWRLIDISVPKGYWATLAVTGDSPLIFSFHDQFESDPPKERPPMG